MAKKNEINADFLEAMTITLRKQLGRTVKQMAKMVQTEMKKNSSVQDSHTADWLKQHGHPYTERNLHSTPIVHRQTDDEKVGKRGSDVHISDNIEIFEGERKGDLEVGVDSNKVPYVEAVLFGTEKLISRDFIAFSLLNTQKKLRKRVIKNLKESVRNQGKKVKEFGKIEGVKKIKKGKNG